MLRPATTLYLTALMFSGIAAAAGPLTDALVQARRFDAQYQAALSERDANQISAQTAAAALYPQIQLGLAQADTYSAPRQTFSITQPLFNLDRYATYKEAGPREILTTAILQQREQELGQRLLKAVADLLRNNEALRLNTAKLDALTGQALAAKKGFEAGQGTVTDMRDAQVRLDQTRAETLALVAQIGSAQRLISTITGAQASALMLPVPRIKRAVVLKPIDQYMRDGVNANPALIQIQQNKALADLAVTRAKGALWPTVSAVYTYSKGDDGGNNSAGVSLSLPLQPGNFFQARGAVASATRLQEQLRDTETRTRLEVQRLWSLVDSGRSEIAIRLEAIKSAELSVEANEKSFVGGVRSQIDVLNSIQTKYQVEQEYVNAVLIMAENYFDLLLQAATPVDEAMATVQAVLFPQL